jgi:hypothetical protein
VGAPAVDWFKIEANKACEYEVSFVTSNGCTGDKTKTFSTARVADNYVVVTLRKACGSLITQLHQEACQRT